jgi:hypothetical protein
MRTAVIVVVAIGARPSSAQASVFGAVDHSEGSCRAVMSRVVIHEAFASDAVPPLRRSSGLLTSE